MWDSLADLITVCKDKIYGTDVERTISEEVAIAKAEAKLATIAREIEKESGKIKDKTIKKSYIDAVKRIRRKVK
jgi:hypothetical protein